MAISFKLNGKPSAEVMKGWSIKRSASQTNAALTHREITWSQPGGGLEVRCEGVEYNDFPTVEWTVYLKNTAATDSPNIEDLHAIDLNFRGDAGGGDIVLHHNTGSPCTPTDYQPHDDKLAPNDSKRITTAGGRSTNSDLPFFNLDFAGRGAIVALGWPGQWAADFRRDSGGTVRVVAGQELTHFRLHAMRARV